MTPTEYNDGIVKLGAAAGLINQLPLDAMSEQVDELFKLLGESTTDDNGQPIDESRRQALRVSLMGMRQLVRAAIAFRQLMPQLNFGGDHGQGSSR